MNLATAPRSSMPPIVFSTPAYAALAGEVCRLLGGRKGEVLRDRFPDGEGYLRIESRIAGERSVIVGATRTDAELVEMLSLAWQMARNGAGEIDLVVPYFGYSTMERAVRPGEVVRAKVNAVLLSSLPRPPGGITVYLVDLHAPGIEHYFEGEIRVVHLSAREAIASKLKEILRTETRPLVVGSADTGRVKLVEAYAENLGAGVAIATKRRRSGSTPELLQLGGAGVKGRTVVLYDDMIRSGGTFVGAAEAYRQAGAERIIGACTHLVLTGHSPEKTLDRVLERLDGLVATDSARTLAEFLSPAGRRLYAVSLAPLLALALGNPPSATGASL